MWRGGRRRVYHRGRGRSCSFRAVCFRGTLSGSGFALSTERARREYQKTRGRVFGQQTAHVMKSLMNQKLLPIYLLFVCQFQLVAEATGNETVILWSTVSPSGTYALARPKTISTSSDSDKGAANGKPATELAIVNLQTKEPILDFSGFGATDLAPLDPLDASSTHWFCAWAPQEDHLLVVNALDPLACLQVDLPGGHVSNVGSTLVAAATRVANGPTTRKPSYSARSPHLSVIDAHFISAHDCYVTVNIDSGSGSDARRVDLYF